MDLSRFIAGVRGVRQTVNPAMTSSQQHPEALEKYCLPGENPRRSHQRVERRCSNQTRRYGGCGICLAPCMPPAKLAKGFARIRSWHTGSQADLRSCTAHRTPAPRPTSHDSVSVQVVSPRLDNRGSIVISESGTERREGDIGSAWLPVCHLRSLPNALPGFIAGIRGVKQTAFYPVYDSTCDPYVQRLHPLELIISSCSWAQDFQRLHRCCRLQVLDHVVATRLPC